jgi:hypothetical protein
MRQISWTNLASLSCTFALATTPSHAQETPLTHEQPLEDWEYATDSKERLHIATVSFTGGFSVAVRCYLPDAIIVSIGGVSVQPEATYSASFERADGRTWQGRLTSDPNSTLSVGYSRRFAPFLRGGGRLSLRASNRYGPALRLDVELPTLHENLDRTIEACGVRLDGPGQV